MMRFSSREMYDCEMPIRSATSFWVCSLPFWYKPKRSRMIERSRSSSELIARCSIARSASRSMSLLTASASVPKMSDSSS